MGGAVPRIRQPGTADSRSQESRDARSLSPRVGPLPLVAWPSQPWGSSLQHEDREAWSGEPAPPGVVGGPLPFLPQPCLPFWDGATGPGGARAPKLTQAPAAWSGHLGVGPPRLVCNCPEQCWGRPSAQGGAPTADSSYQVTRGPGRNSLTLASKEEARTRTPATGLCGSCSVSCVPCPSASTLVSTCKQSCWTPVESPLAWGLPHSALEISVG